MLSQRRSIRLPEFDYAQAGYYFVTLLAYHRNPIFGNINPSGEVVLNSSGKIAFYEWKNLKRDLKTSHLTVLEIIGKNRAKEEKEAS